MAAWRKYVHDPDDAVEEWFLTGSPMGIKRTPVDRGIFPLYPDALAVTDPSTLATEELGAEAVTA